MQQGKVIYVGSSNFAGWHIARANEIAGYRHFLGLVSEQSLYNLTARTVELEVLPACREYGMGFISYSPLAGGLLARRAAEGRRRAGADEEYMQEEIDAYRDQLEKFEKLCADLGERPADVALAWLLANPVVTAPDHRAAHAGAAATARCARSNVELTPETLELLDEIFPGPGGSGARSLRLVVGPSPVRVGGTRARPAGPARLPVARSGADRDGGRLERGPSSGASNASPICGASSSSSNATCAL